MAKAKEVMTVMAVGNGGTARLAAQMIINGQITYAVALHWFPQLKEEIDWYLRWYGHPELIEEV